ncbi:hypothetical protein C7256_07065 [Enterocloster lavalensis]|nr:hypothetical protein C7256_07065 [Enterocloster lavalensis]
MPTDDRPHGPRVCLKIHSHHLHAPLCGIFGPNSVNVARYASLIGTKSPTKCDAHLAESNFQTHPSVEVCREYPVALREILG